MMLRRGSILAALVVFGTGAVGPNAHACGNGVEHALNVSTQAIALADREVQRGQSSQALRRISRVYPKLARATISRSSRQDRALRVMATAVMRLEGNVDGYGFSSKTEEQRGENLRWATHTLRGLSLRHPGLRGLVAEALAKDPARQQEALELLVTLEQEDLLDSFGLAALASVRRTLAASQPSWLRAPRRALHSTLAAIEEDRCLRMTNSAARCTEPAPRDPS